MQPQSPPSPTEPADAVATNLGGRGAVLAAGEEAFPQGVAHTVPTTAAAVSGACEDILRAPDQKGATTKQHVSIQMDCEDIQFIDSRFRSQEGIKKGCDASWVGFTHNLSQNPSPHFAGQSAGQVPALSPRSHAPLRLQGPMADATLHVTQHSDTVH